MIRILHLTDFHLNIKTLKDWNDFLKEPFFKSLDSLQNERKIDLVLFTGDMIDKAGLDFGSASEGFKIFKDEIITSVINHIGLDISKFIICPGNHDINRNADKEFIEKGLLESLNSANKINDFMNTDESDYDGIMRIKEYKHFEFSLYENISAEKIQSKFKFSIKLNINDKLIGISSLNSAWRCYSDDDCKKIIIGDNQLNDNLKFINDCELKIAIMHHQLDWISEYEAKNIKAHISNGYDFIFSGHVHETDTNYIQNLTGKIVSVVSPSGLNQIRQTDRNNINGFSLIDISEVVKCHYFKYNHTQKKFVDNTDVCDKGIFEIELNSFDIISDNEDFRLIVDDEFSDFLNDSGANFTHRSKKLMLDDIYVSPFLEQFSLIEQDEKNSTVSLDYVFSKILNFDLNHTVFLGEENSGKTSLCKQLYKKLLSVDNVLPVYIKGRDVKNVSDKDIEKLISKESKIQYKNYFDNHEYRKVIIVDDFNYCLLPSKSKRHFISYLQSTDYITVFTWDEFFTLSDLLESQTINLDIYEILKFGTKKRLELIRKWIDLIDDDFRNENDKEFQINYLFKTVNSVIGKNLVPSLPIYILTILQANELTTNVNFEQSTFGHYYDVLIKSAIGQKIFENKEIEKYYSYLTELSFRIFSDEAGVIDLTEDSMIDFHRFFQDKYKLRISFKDIIRVLEETNLILEVNNSYKFKYKYIYFYFIGKYLSDNIEDDNIKSIVIDLSDKLYQVESANIYVFLSHHSRSRFVMKQILKRGKELFNEQILIGFNDDIKHINGLIDSVTEKINFDSNKSTDEHKSEEFEGFDAEPDKSNNLNQKHEDIDGISKINKAFKTIEILGYIIKNRYASLNGADKEELVEELYKLGLRSLTFIFETLLKGEEYIKNEIIEIIRKDPSSTLTSSEREGLAKQFMFNLLYMISYSIFKRISNSISSKDLEITFDDVKNKLINEIAGKRNNAVSLIDIAIVFEYSKSFPESDVKELSKEFKSNPLAFSILRRLGVNYMRMMPMKENEQQKASELLNISMQKQRVIGGSSKIKR